MEVSVCVEWHVFILHTVESVCKILLMYAHCVRRPVAVLYAFLLVFVMSATAGGHIDIFFYSWLFPFFGIAMTLPYLY